MARLAVPFIVIAALFFAIRVPLYPLPGLLLWNAEQRRGEAAH